MDKLAKGLDDVDIFPRPSYYQLRTFVETIVKHLQTLENVAPIFALIVEAFVQHVHDIVKVLRATTSTNTSVANISSTRSIHSTCCR
jgi:hypothetical protein